jgi:hypothetical protein
MRQALGSWVRDWLGVGVIIVWDPFLYHILHAEPSAFSGAEMLLGSFRSAGDSQMVCRDSGSFL